MTEILKMASLYCIMIRRNSKSDVHILVLERSIQAVKGFLFDCIYLNELKSNVDEYEVVFWIVSSVLCDVVSVCDSESSGLSWSGVSMCCCSSWCCRWGMKTGADTQHYTGLERLYNTGKPMRGFLSAWFNAVRACRCRSDLLMACLDTIRVSVQC